MDVFWLEATPFATSGGVQTVRACSVDLSPIVLFGGSEWLPVLDGGLITSTSVFNGQFTGRAETTRGQLALITGAGEIDIWASYRWAARSVKVWKGTIDASDPAAPVFPVTRTLIFDGEAESFDPDEGILHLQTRMPNGLVASASYAGTGGLEGSSELKGVPKPFAVGVHTNRKATLISAGKLMFQVHGYGAITALTKVRERGIQLDQAMVAHSSWANLNAATVPATEIHYHLDSGTFRLGFTPQGDITADFTGDSRAASGYVGNLVYAMLQASGWDMAKVDLTSLNALNAGNPNNAQFYDDAGVDIAEALTTICAGAGGYWDVDELGTFYVGLVQMAGAADFAIGEEGYGTYDILELDHLPVRPPFWKVRLAYNFNPSIQTYADTEAGATAEQLELIQSIQDLVDGSVDIFFQSTPPATGNENDLWRDSDDGLWYKRQSGSWVLTAGLGALGEALAAAAGAQATADGKIRSFYQDATPTSPSIGDLWTRPSDVPKVTKRWNGSIWEEVAKAGAKVGVDVYTPTGTVYAQSDLQTNLGTALGIQGQAPAATDPTIQPGATNDKGEDTRSVNFPPSYYRTNYLRRMRLEFKAITDLGTAPTGASGTYGYLETFAPWADGTGGPVTQRLTDSSGARFIRYSTSEAAWGAWEREFSGNAKPYFGSDLLESFGGVIATLAAFKTLLGIALGIQGQAPAATDATIEASADVTKAIADYPALIEIAYDSDGNAKTDEFPKLATFKLKTSGGSTITSGVTWSVAVVKGAASVAMSGTGTGQLTISAPFTVNEATIVVSAAYGGRTYQSASVTIRKKVDTPPISGGGGGGGGGGTGPFTGSFSTATPTVVATMTATAGAGGTIQVRATAIELRPSGGTFATSNCRFQLQWNNGGSWTDIGSPVDSDPDPYVVNEGGGITYPESGYISLSYDHTGRTNGTPYSYRIVAHIASGALRTIVPVGDLTGTPT